MSRARLGYLALFDLARCAQLRDCLAGHYNYLALVLSRVYRVSGVPQAQDGLFVPFPLMRHLPLLKRPLHPLLNEQSEEKTMRSDWNESGRQIG